LLTRKKKKEKKTEKKKDNKRTQSITSVTHTLLVLIEGRRRKLKAASREESLQGFIKWYYTQRMNSCLWWDAPSFLQVKENKRIKI